MFGRHRSRPDADGHCLALPWDWRAEEQNWCYHFLSVCLFVFPFSLVFCVSSVIMAKGGIDKHGREIG